VRDVQAAYTFPIEAVTTVEAAVRDADLIVTATSSSEPVLKRNWISQGAHLNVVGASQSFAREVDSATMAASSLFVDRRESTLNESGDYLFALRDGAIGLFWADRRNPVLGRNPVHRGRRHGHVRAARL
jgi:ornithine cyclodeaminase